VFLKEIKAEDFKRMMGIRCLNRRGEGIRGRGWEEKAVQVCKSCNCLVFLFARKL
jgi:hypothetical protein